MKVSIITLGCPKNTVLTRNMQSLLKRHNIPLTKNPEEAEIIAVNTCAFIEKAVMESIETLLELAKHKKKGRCKKILAVGCLVDRYQDKLVKSLPEVDGFVGLQMLPSLISFIDESLLNTEDFSISHNGNPWAYLQISEGCSKNCSFCTIPFIRGPYRSRLESEILQEAEILVDKGVREVVIIGQDTGMFGYDTDGKEKLSGLLNKLAQISSLSWIRLMYLHPQHLTKSLIEILADNPKLCAYLDIPFQHGSKKILKSMNRWGDKEKYLHLIKTLRKKIPHVALRTSVILGYPGETQQDFQTLVDFVKEAAFDYVGIFQFSAEEGTKAAKLGKKVPPEITQERFFQLRRVADNLNFEKKKRLINSVLPVMLDKPNLKEAQAYHGLQKRKDQYWEGRLEIQAPEVDGVVLVSLKNKAKRGQIIDAQIKGFNGYDFLGYERD